ncbi:ferritin-like domain-containing protein [Ottowia thiooxydans]|uniref:ferritin-like domain-containing protein n=1 Tax=Ottowia thiooxydans TaxID=219182 RepID=UPI00041CB204|nr:ferritin-like domain-containing protein [Ottowia thiooxydans]
METLRSLSLDLLTTTDPNQKASLTRAMSAGLRAGADDDILARGIIPGRPAKPILVAHTGLVKRSVHTNEGRAALIHSLAHIELNAIDLALDICWRFKGMPDLFYEQWMGIAREEALHFELLRDHLATLDVRYGDLPAHNALWDMAERTRHDLLARIALVPRTAEARGLDASPPIRAKLAKAGDHEGAAILDIILRDEIGHVAVGNHWYNWLCQQRGLDPVATYAELAQTYDAPRLRGPFNMEARLAAGFSLEELELMGQ